MKMHILPFICFGSEIRYKQQKGILSFLHAFPVLFFLRVQDCFCEVAQNSPLKNSVKPMMDEEPSEDTIMEVRQDFMLSSTRDSKPTFRTARFLKPISNSIDEQPPFKFNPFSSSSSSVSEPAEWPLTIHFDGWRRPQTKWFRWVDQLKLKYESLWKKVGIFEAIMSTRCRINKNQDLLYGVVEKWCCETNTFVFPIGEATITLEDIMVLGGYPILGDPVFISLEDQQMKEVEEKLILARRELYKTKQGKARTSIWMDIFIDKSSEIEHEAFLATWLSIFVFPRKNMLVKSCLFPISIHLARGNPIALAPAVLATIYKDLSLFKKTIVGMKKYPDGGVTFPLEITLESPFYLVQIWIWERFTDLQPEPRTMMFNHGEPLLFRWHKVKALKIDNVRLAIDSVVSDFLWRPYVKYADKCGMFNPNDEILVPFMKVLVDRQMLSFVICMRVSELVGFNSIEQYLPHRVAMQFGMDQDVPSYVPRFNETKAIAWKNYYRPISDKILNFPSRFFDPSVTARYARWWKQTVLGHDDFVKKIVQRKRSASSRKQRTDVGKANRSGNDIGVPPGFPPNLVDTLIFGKFCYDGLKTKTRKVDDLYADVPYENSVHNHMKADKNIDADVPYETQGERQSKSFSVRKEVSSKETVQEKARDDEVMVLLKEKNLMYQKELGSLARKQEEMLWLMALREKRDEELRQLLTSFLRNLQPPPPPSS